VGVCVVTLLPVNFNCLRKGDCSWGFLVSRINMERELPPGHAMQQTLEDCKKKAVAPTVHGSLLQAAIESDKQERTSV
jgi:hypothetical protein